MKRLIVILAMCLLAAVGAGGYAWWTNSSVLVKTNSGTEKTRGFVRKIFVDQDGQEHKYLVFVPYDYQPGQKRPLLLFLNGRGENGDDGLKMISRNFGMSIWEMKRFFPFVCAIPQCEVGRVWTGSQMEKAIGFMDQVSKEYETDPDRVYVTGVSVGGEGVWNIVSMYPRRFAAAVPLCSPPDGDTDKLSDMHIPIWIFYNDGDKATVVDANRTMYQSLLNSGASPIITEYNRKRHNCWDVVYRCEGLCDWLLGQSSAKNARQTRRFELLPAEQLLADWQSHGANGWKATEDGALEYKGPSPEKPGYLVSKKVYDAGEFHLEVFWESEASSCRLGLFDDLSNDVLSGYMLTLLFTNSGDGDLVHSTNGWISSIDPAAQHQLRTGYWNDVRVHFGKGRIRMRINGWRALDAPMQASGEKPLHLAIVSPDANSGLRWRNVRVRVPDY